ncbi:MAG: tetratricopeptide repeat protein [Vulcanimicrobiota bacterium]
MRYCDSGPQEQDVHRVVNPVEWKQAEAFRLTGVYGRAAKYFRACWEEEKKPDAGWRYANCLRKTGLAEAALTLLRDLSTQFPEDQEVRDELVWCIYDARLTKAKEESRSADVIAHAKDMLGAGAEGLALKLAVFAVMGVAKTKGQWNQVSCWCDLLDPSTLSTVSRKGKQGTIPSEQERWYYGKVKSLVKLEDWHQAESVASEALALYATNEHFLRWKAQTLAGLGRLEEAVQLLEGLGPDTPWYALADLANYSFLLERVEKAWELAVAAAKAPGQPTAKVNLWELLAKTSLALNKPDSAYWHLSLAIRIREEQNWPLRPHHKHLEQQVLKGFEAAGLSKNSSRELLKSCRQYWNPGSAPSKKPEAGPAKPTGNGKGRVVGWDSARPFAFIEPDDGSEQIFVLTKDLPPESQQNRAPVSYKVIHHFDKRKNKQSLRAVDISPGNEFSEEW